jgi:hypothetical protein
LRSQGFELVCADAHPLGCIEVMRSQDRGTLVALARDNAERLAAIANAVTPR